MNLNFSENFKKLRKEKCETQEMIAEFLGVTGQTVSRWELGMCYPDIEFLVDGENLIAVHTLYQGLINRVWQSGDFRHGLICDIVINDAVVLSSDKSFRVKNHSGYSEMGICGYQTQFIERYDSRTSEVGFEKVDFDDSDWCFAEECHFDLHPHRSKIQPMTKSLVLQGFFGFLGLIFDLLFFATFSEPYGLEPST